MNRYIDAEKFYADAVKWEKEAYEQLVLIDTEHKGKDEWNKWNAILNERTAFKHDIMDAPKADVEEVRHGEWIDTGSGQKCSVCGEIQYGYDNYRYRCSYCGAKMDKEKKE